MSQLLMTTETFAGHSAGYCVRQGFSLVLASGDWARSQYKRLHKFDGWGLTCRLPRVPNPGDPEFSP
jgi:hypothetical protein